MGSDDVIDNQSRHRFELTVDGVVAHLDYTLHGERLDLVHTAVPEELGGRGIGGMLVEAAVARARTEDLAVVETCPYVRSWMAKHPDVAATVRHG